MGSPLPVDLPPDPYIALGLAKDATAAAIKTQYRKLALKFHPDKVQDESQKNVAADQFHKIQTAYEIVGDEDRRARYDAQCKLAALRKEMMERGGVGAKPHIDVRTAGYKMPPESTRGGDFFARGPDRSRVSPQYEYRTPSYAQPEQDYFDIPPRPTARKEPEFERTSKRAPPREEREKSRSSPKENERSSRKEKSRRTERDIRRDRDSKKQTYVTVEEEDSESESEYERATRRMREEDEEKRAREQYRETVRRQKEEAEQGYYPDERARKMFSQGLDAREYIDRSTARTTPRERPESERRPSPIRNTSSKDKVESIKRGADSRPSAFRRDSGRPKTTGRDTEPKKSSSRAKDSKPIEIVEEVQPTKRSAQPPPFVQSKSSPADIRPPFDRQRSYSVQEPEHLHEQINQVKRSETMPQQHTAANTYDSRRNQSSKLRAEVRDGYLTPERSPEPQAREPQVREPQARKYHYGQEYADDREFPTPDGYRTEIREPDRPSKQRVTRSPSPKEQRGRQRTGSAQYTAAPQPPQMPRTSSYTYKHMGAGQGVESYTRPPPSRENSGRGDHALFGEIRESRSPKYNQSKYSPPPENVHYSPRVRQEDIKYQTGYGSRRPTEKFSRGNSGQQAVYVK